MIRERELGSSLYLLDNQHQHVCHSSVFHHHCLTPIGVDPIMYIGSPIPSIVAPRARQCSIVQHCNNIFVILAEFPTSTKIQWRHCRGFAISRAKDFVLQDFALGSSNYVHRIYGLNGKIAH